MAKAMARHILVKTEAEAAQLKQRIAKGEAFDRAGTQALAVPFRQTRRRPG